MTLAQIVPVVIGGLVTLSTTFVVQVFVIPWVQGRTRRRERWENDVLELSALLEEELPRALNGYKVTSYPIYGMKQWLGNEQYNQEKVQELWQSSTTELREAGKAVGERMARLKILDSRIRRLRPRAPYWGRLSLRRTQLQLAVCNVEDVVLPENPEAHWDEEWKSLQTALKELCVTLDEIANPTKPPPRQLAHRVRQYIKRCR